MTDAWRLIISIGVCELVGVIGAFFTMPAIETWYAGLRKPVFTPPGWLFGPVWTLLYLLMGIAAYAVWKKGLTNWQVRHALVLFIVQLALNLAWSIIFFGMHSISGALIDIVLLWVAIIFTMIGFFRISKTAGVFMVPYFLWVTFAMILNFSLWLLNR